MFEHPRIPNPPFSLWALHGAVPAPPQGIRGDFVLYYPTFMVSLEQIRPKSMLENCLGRSLQASFFFSGGEGAPRKATFVEPEREPKRQGFLEESLASVHCALMVFIRNLNMF